MAERRWAGALGVVQLLVPTFAAAKGVGRGVAAIRGSGQAGRGFGGNGLYRAPNGTANEIVRSIYLTEVNSRGFGVKLFLHNVLTPGWRWVTKSMIRERVAAGAFGRGAFSVKPMDASGRLLFGGSDKATFLNRQFFHHELIHVSQIIKSPNLWSTFPLRMLHEPMQLFTAHGATVWPVMLGGTAYGYHWWHD